jgi:hypothetical protein
MDLDNTLRGHLIAGALEVLLVDAGYHVIPIGIERNLRELRSIGLERYLDLAPRQLRTCPDFFVLDRDGQESRLVEIKFRRYLHRNLLGDLREIAGAWAPFVLVLVAGEPPDEWRGAIRHIRAFVIEHTTELDGRFLYTGGLRLQDVFVRLRDKWSDRTILRVEEAIVQLVAADEE